MFKKSLNLVLLYLSYRFSRLLARPVHWGMPFSLSVEPVNYCNLHCPQCPTGLAQITRPKGFMPLDVFEALLSQLAGSLSYMSLFFQGEPFLHPQLPEFARQAKLRGIFSAVSTNGHFLTNEMARRTVESGLDRLIVSVDGASQEVYEKYRIGGNLQLVLDGIQRILSWRGRMGLSHPLLEMQFIVFGVNESEIERMKSLKESLGADRLVLKTAQVYDYQNGSDFLTSLPRFSRYKKSPEGDYRIKNRFPNHCWRMWSGAVVTEDGKVLPCCFDKDAEHVMGNIHQQPFSEIWKGERYKAFRLQVLTSRAQITMCRNCTEGTKARDRYL